MRFFIISTSLLLLAVFSQGCLGQTVNTNSLSQQSESSGKESVDFPPIGKPKKVTDGVLVYEVKLKRESITNKVWVYLPEKPSKERVPLVLIAPAGSRLVDGMNLGEGDRTEHIPYVKSGFAVVAYEIDGELKDRSEKGIIKASTAFMKSNAGLVNQKNALDYALAKFPVINPEQIFVAGHSSAGTHALLVGANEPRVKGIVAYAPAADIKKFIGDKLEAYDDYITGFQTFITQSSPINNVSKIKAPVFIFHSKDDPNVSIKMSEEFVEKLKINNSDITFIQVEKGGHYDSMIKEGIPKAINWLYKQIGQ